MALYSLVYSFNLICLNHFLAYLSHESYSFFFSAVVDSEVKCEREVKNGVHEFGETKWNFFTMDGEKIRQPTQ